MQIAELLPVIRLRIILRDQADAERCWGELTKMKGVKIVEKRKDLPRIEVQCRPVERDNIDRMLNNKFDFFRSYKI